VGRERGERGKAEAALLLRRQRPASVPARVALRHAQPAVGTASASRLARAGLLLRSLLARKEEIARLFAACPAVARVRQRERCGREGQQKNKREATCAWRRHASCGGRAGENLLPVWSTGSCASGSHRPTRRRRGERRLTAAAPPRGHTGSNPPNISGVPPNLAKVATGVVAARRLSQPTT
jgi:hypothetical protein